MNPRVYLETSVISYLAARPSTEMLVATRQVKSFELWQLRDSMGLCVSVAVREEAARGDAHTAQARLGFCNALPQLSLSPSAVEIAEELVSRRAIPAKAYTDAIHIAIAAVHGIEFIASWNFKHIAGAAARRGIERALSEMNLHATTIATPEEILESPK